jgi:hypothetical protein
MSERRRGPDLRAWVMLVWIAWFGLAYARMYLAAKGGLILALLGRLTLGH